VDRVAASAIAVVGSDVDQARGGHPVRVAPPTMLSCSAGAGRGSPPPASTCGRPATAAIIDRRAEGLTSSSWTSDAPTFTTEGLEAALHLREIAPDVGVLVLSQYVETRHAIRLLQSGTDGIGYLLKERVGDLGELVAAVRRIGSGGSVIDPEVVGQLLGRPRAHGPLDELTPRERQVLELMAEGRSNQGIADALGLNTKTVEAHINGIFLKLDLEPAPEDHRRVLAVLTYLRA
jgi:DNA-binding NarL/FixJ family response regulator